MNKPLTFSEFRHNLIELQTSDSLVATPSGHKIYAIKSWRGRLLCWIYRWSARLFVAREGWGERAWEKALRKTEAAYWSALEQLEKSLDDYEKMTAALYRKREVERKNWFEAGNAIIRLRSTLFPFWDARRRKKLPAQMISFENSREEEREKSLLECRSFEAFHLAKLTNEVGLLPAIELFGTLSETAEAKCLMPNQKIWLNGLSEFGKRGGMHTIHQAFLGIASIVEKERGVSEVVGEWAIFLDRLGCDFVKADDPEQIAWVRATCRPGVTMENGERAWRLGKKISLLGEATGRYELEGEEDKTIVFPTNPFFAHSMPYRMVCPYGVRPLELVDISRGGRFFVQKKMISSLVEEEWDREAMPVEGSVCQRKLLAVANLVRFYWARQASPKAIHPGDLFFDGEGRLVSAATLERDGRFDVVVMEEFLSEVAKGDLFIFAFLMHVSGLYKHPARVYFKKLLSAYAKKGNIEKAKPDTIKGSEYEESWYHAHGERVCRALDEQIVRYQEKMVEQGGGRDLFVEEMTQRRETDTTKERKRVGKLIIKLYEKTGCVALILPAIIIHIQKSTHFPNSFERKYIKSINLLSQYEYAAGEMTD